MSRRKASDPIEAVVQRALDFIGDGVTVNDFVLEFDLQAVLLLDRLKQRGLVREEYSHQFSVTVLMRGET